MRPSSTPRRRPPVLKPDRDRGTAARLRWPLYPVRCAALRCPGSHNDIVGVGGQRRASVIVPMKRSLRSHKQAVGPAANSPACAGSAHHLERHIERTLTVRAHQAAGVCSSGQDSTRSAFHGPAGPCCAAALRTVSGRSASGRPGHRLQGLQLLLPVLPLHLRSLLRTPSLSSTSTSQSRSGSVISHTSSRRVGAAIEKLCDLGGCSVLIMRSAERHRALASAVRTCRQVPELLRPCEGDQIVVGVVAHRFE